MEIHMLFILSLLSATHRPKTPQAQEMRLKWQKKVLFRWMSCFQLWESYWKYSLPAYPLSILKPYAK